MNSIDLKIFYYFYNITGQSHNIDYLVIFLSEYLFYVMCGALIIYFALNLIKTKTTQFYNLLFVLAVALFARFGVVEIIRLFYQRVRPFSALTLTHNVLTDSSYSFPSGHTTFIFAFATVIYFTNKKLGIVTAVLGLIIGIARVSAGVHYPSDILGGIIVGVACGLLAIKIRSMINNHS